MIVFGFVANRVSFGAARDGGRLDVLGRFACIACIAFLALLCAAPVQAQQLPGMPGSEATEEVAPDELSAAAIAARRSALGVEQKALVERRAAAGPADRAHLDFVDERLRRLALLLEKQAGLADELAAPEEALEAAPAADVEISVAGLNTLYEARFARESLGEQGDREIEAARGAVQAAKEKLDTAEKARRRARQELEAEGASVAEPTARALEVAKLASRVAAEELHLRSLELQAARAPQATASTEALDAQIGQVRAALGQAGQQETASTNALAEREAGIRHAREQAERRLATAEVRLKAAESRFARMDQAPPEALAEVEAFAAQREAIRREISLADERLERLAEQRTVSEKWSALLRNQMSAEQLDAEVAAVATRVEGLEQDEHALRLRAADTARRLEAVSARIAGRAAGTPLRDALEEQRAALASLSAMAQSELAALGADRRLTQRYQDDLAARSGRIEPLALVSAGLSSASSAWSYEITAVEDEPITVGSLVLAVVLFAVGLWASRRAAALVSRVAEQRFKLDAGGSHALQTLAFYGLLLSFTLMALRAVHFPLTAFTVLGGAVAIGVGFGSQNVMNNFISGLILMLERPVRARDVVEVDGNHGTIEAIGARSTQIRSTDGRHIVVPNSFFLETNVVNWTLSDELVRTKVLVGVMYGSPTRLVEELIARAVEEEEAALKQPAPVILFNEFGDNSLNFEVHFWVRARSPMEMKKVESRLRFAIDDLFREHELVIAFPQRDVHLDTLTPLQVRMVAGSDDPKAD